MNLPLTTVFRELWSRRLEASTSKPAPVNRCDTAAEKLTWSPSSMMSPRCVKTTTTVPCLLAASACPCVRQPHSATAQRGPSACLGSRPPPKLAVHVALRQAPPPRGITFEPRVGEDSEKKLLLEAPADAQRRQQLQLLLVQLRAQRAPATFLPPPPGAP
jgi:hypothetical protein